MKFKLLLLVLIQVLSCVSMHLNSNSYDSIYVVGTIHGNMLDNPNNTLRDFVSALYQYKPTLILTEVRPEVPDVVESIIDGAPVQAIICAFARENGSTIIPIDWFNEAYNFESSQEDQKLSSTAKAEIDPLFIEFHSVVQNCSFLTSQEARAQNSIRERYDILSKHGLTALRRRDQLTALV